MRFFKSLLFLLALSAVGAGSLAYRGYRIAHEPFRGFAEEEVFFTVDRGASGARIGRSLEEQGIVRDRSVFVLALRFLGRGRMVKAGEYRFADPLSTVEVMEKLIAGDVYTFPVTIPEGLTLAETAGHLAGLDLADAGELRARFEEREAIRDIDPDAPNLEGYLYPTTYRFTRNVTADEVSQTLVEQFKQVFSEERRAKAKERGLTARELVTFASVIEKETGVPEERPLISSVFWNRLRIGMPLQSDPTIIYVLKLEDRYDGNLRKADLEIDSPYNTYRFPGLPPGPIASPGEAAIAAVLEPAETTYLYFVSRNDGSHHFSTTYSEHVDAVRKYQVEYFRRRRSR